MGFANSVVPTYWAVPKWDPINPLYYMKETAVPMDTMKCGYEFCGLCYPEKAAKKNTPKEIEVNVTLKQATKNFKDSVNSRVKNDKATIDVSFSPYSKPAQGNLNLYVPSAYGEGTYASVGLDADDLKALQDAVYKVRVEIAKGEIKNEDVYPF
jgi:hypothetical protein